MVAWNPPSPRPCAAGAVSLRRYDPIAKGQSAPRSTISNGMTNPHAHAPDYDYWCNQYPHECTCGASASRRGPDPAQDLLLAIQADIAEIRRRLHQIEVQVTA